jgi:hypothetical protein
MELAVAWEMIKAWGAYSFKHQGMHVQRNVLGSQTGKGTGRKVGEHRGTVVVITMEPVAAQLFIGVITA